MMWCMLFVAVHVSCILCPLQHSSPLLISPSPPQTFLHLSTHLPQAKTADPSLDHQLPDSHYIHMAGGEIPGNYHDLWLKRRSHMPLSLHHMSTVTSCCTWVVAVSIWYCLPRAKVTSPHVQQCIGCSMTHKWLCTGKLPL